MMWCYEIKYQNNGETIDKELIAFKGKLTVQRLDIYYKTVSSYPEILPTILPCGNDCWIITKLKNPALKWVISPIVVKKYYF